MERRKMGNVMLIKSKGGKPVTLDTSTRHVR